MNKNILIFNVLMLTGFTTAFGMELNQPKLSRPLNDQLVQLLKSELQDTPADLSRKSTHKLKQIIEACECAIKSKEEQSNLSKKLKINNDRTLATLKSIQQQAQAILNEELKVTSQALEQAGSAISYPTSVDDVTKAPTQNPIAEPLNTNSKMPAAQCLPIQEDIEPIAINVQPSLAIEDIEPIKENETQKPLVMIQTNDNSKLLIQKPAAHVLNSAADGLQLSMSYTVPPKSLDARALDEVEQIIGYRFKNKELLIQALTTREKDPEKNYERYEYCGDSILGAIIDEILVEKYQDADPGMLTDANSQLTRQEALGALCLRLGLHQYIQNQESNIPISSLCDIIESIINVICKDGGAEAGQDFVVKFFMPMIKDKECPVAPSTIIKNTAKELNQNIDYLWVGDIFCGMLKSDGTGIIKNSKPKKHKLNPDTKKDSNRLALYLAERELIQKELPLEYQKSLVRLAIDSDYQPLSGTLPKLNISWDEGIKANARERLHTLIQKLGTTMPQYKCEEGAKEEYKKIQTSIVCSPDIANIANVTNDLDITNPVESLYSFCKTHRLEMPTYVQELNSKNGIYCTVNVPWLAIIIKGPSKSTYDLAKTETAKQIITLIKHLSMQFIEPEKLHMIERYKKGGSPTNMLIQLCQYINLKQPSIKTHYCEGLVTDPICFKTIMTMADKSWTKKPIIGQKAYSAMEAQNNAAKKASQYILNKMIKREIQPK